MSYTWLRVANQSAGYSIGWFWLAAINAGSTYRRVRFGWGFQAFTDVTTDLHAVSINPLFAGLVTTIGNGTEVPPNPLDSPTDADPPTLRWLWWEIRQPRAIAIDAAGGVVSWTDSGAQEVTDVKTQVLAPSMPAGDTLNLWFTWSSTFGNWDLSGEAQVFAWSSTLVSVP